MRMHHFMPVMMSLLILVGCATSTDSTLLGVGIGSVVGGGMGAGMGTPNHNELRSGLVGAAVGAAIGGLCGYMYHKEDEERKRAQKFASPMDRQGTPEMTMPKIRRIWVPDKADGNQLIRGHWTYSIESPSTWRVDDNEQHNQ